MTASAGSERLTSLVRQWAPHLQVVSVSQPEPHLERFNVVATTSDADGARAAVVDLEAEELDDARIGLVVLGSPRDEDETTGVDPEGLGRTVVPRILTGGALGAVVGGVVGAAVAALSGGTAPVILGAALGGAVLLAVLGAIWAAFRGFGGSDAYRQTFVDDAVSELNVVSLHTDDEAEAHRALDRLAKHPDLDVRLLDARGAPVSGRAQR